MTDLQEPAPPVVGNQWERRYKEVNEGWPLNLPSLTGQEAISAAKRLYRFAMKKALAVVPGSKWTVTSGNRRNDLWMRRVNPERGWHDLVHHLSHACHHHLHPGADPHGPGHSFIEKEMIAYVIANGWLDGRLKRPAKAKPAIRDVRYARIVARIAAWERKKKRAETALKKLRKTKAYYDRQH